MKRQPLYLSGEPGIFEPILRGLGIGYTAYTNISGPPSGPPDLSMDGLASAEESACLAAADRSRMLQRIRRELPQQGFYAGVSHVTTSRGRPFTNGAGPALLGKVRGACCIVSSAISICPVEGLSLPLPDYDMVVSVKFETELIERDVFVDLRRKWKSMRRDFPTDPLTFLDRFYGRSFLLSSGGTSASMMTLDEIVRWKREELKGLLEIAGYL